MKRIEFYDNKNVTSKQLKIARIKSGLTQNQLAAKMQISNIDIDQKIISKIENNRRIVTDYELACFCKILSTDEKDMLKDYYDNFTQ